MFLKKSKLRAGETVEISGSKSISNRLLILQKLFGNIEIKNLSSSEDTSLMQNALQAENKIIDIHHAGTAMRFLTSYFAIQPGKTVTITGSERMKQRPIKFLVNALRELGADIECIENEGFPPLKIVGKKLTKNSVQIPADISSQFITSLMLIGGKLKNGLDIELLGKITSRPYLEMTAEMLSEIGIKNSFTGNLIKIFPVRNLEKTTYTVESDWSSASYFYSLCAIGRQEICLKSFKQKSLQGDSALVSVYKKFFGIETEFYNNEVLLKPSREFIFPKEIKLDMNDCPDIAQTLCISAAALKIPFEITGLATLKVKETDRLLALKNELKKIGCEVEISDDSIRTINFISPENNILIKTYNDHRMAMSFAPYCLISDLEIENPQVVEKSYLEFWKDLGKVTV